MTIDQKKEALLLYDEHMTDEERHEYNQFICEMKHLESSYRYLQEHLIRYAHEAECRAERIAAEQILSDEEMDLLMVVGGGGNA